MLEWDETKRAANLAKHGLDFADAAEIFEEYGWKGWTRDRITGRSAGFALGCFAA